MSDELSSDQVRFARLLSQSLVDTARGEGDVVAAVAKVVAVQAQALGPPRFAVRARTSGMRAADVDSACADGRLVRTWAMRGTLHMLPAQDVRWVVGLLGPVFAKAGRRRRDQLGLDDTTCERAFAAIEMVLGESAPLTRAELIDRIRARGVEIDPKTQAPPHLLAYAANRGLICRGPDTDRGEPSYVLLNDSVPAAEPMEREAALAELARRYLAGHGPATAADFRAWSGLPATEAKRGFASITDDDAVEVRADGETMLARHDIDPRDHGAGPARLLGHFDPLLLGYRDRKLILDPAYAKRVQAGGGFIQPTVLAEGRLVGTWSLERRSRDARVVVEPFGELPRGCRDALAEETEDIGRFLDQPAELSIATP